MLQVYMVTTPSILDGSADAMFHPEPTLNDRLSCGKKKLGKRRRDRDEEGVTTPEGVRNGQRRSAWTLHINDGGADVCRKIPG